MKTLKDNALSTFILRFSTFGAKVRAYESWNKTTYRRYNLYHLKSLISNQAMLEQLSEYVFMNCRVNQEITDTLSWLSFGNSFSFLIVLLMLVS